MPRPKGCRRHKKGTNHAGQAAARDEAAATAAAAVQRAAAEALLAMESPAAVVQPSLATAVQPRPNTVAQEERRRFVGRFVGPFAGVIVRVWALWVASGVTVRVWGLCELKIIHTQNAMGTITS